MDNFNDYMGEEKEPGYDKVPPSFEPPIYDGQNNEIEDYNQDEFEKANVQPEIIAEPNEMPDPGSLSGDFMSNSNERYSNYQFEQQPPMKKKGTGIVVAIVGLLVVAAVVLIVASSSVLLSFFKSDKSEEGTTEAVVMLTEKETEEKQVTDETTGAVSSSTIEYDLAYPLYTYIMGSDNEGLEEYIGENKDTVNLDYIDDDVYSPLYFAIICENNEAIRILLHYGADIELADDIMNYGSPLFAALDCDNLEAMEILVENGANVNARDQYGATPVMYAARLDISSFDYLIDAEADVTKIDFYGWNTLHYASYYGNVTTYERGLELGVDESALTDKVYSVTDTTLLGSNVGLLETLLAKGFTLEQPLENGDTLLLIVRSDEMAYYVMENFECDFTATDEYGASPLHYAAYYELSAEVLKLYIENGADVNLQDSDGITPLMNAVPVTENVRLLLDNGADVSIEDYDGYTAYDYITEEDDSYLKVLLRNK